MKILMQSGVFICTQGNKKEIKKCNWVMLKTYPATELKPFELARLSHGVSTTMNGSYSRTCLSVQTTHTEFHDHMTLIEQAIWYYDQQDLRVYLSKNLQLSEVRITSQEPCTPYLFAHQLTIFVVFKERTATHS